MCLAYLAELLESQLWFSAGEDDAGDLDKRRRRTEPNCTMQDYTKASVYLTPWVRGSPTRTYYYIFPSDRLSAILVTLTESSLPRHHCPQANLQSFRGLGQSHVFLGSGPQVWLSNTRVCLWLNAPLTAFSALRPSSHLATCPVGRMASSLHTVGCSYVA